MTGQEIYNFVKELFPICRSLTGDGVRKTLQLIQKRLPELKVHEVPSGTVCFDWTVPKEWNISDAYILDPAGKKIANFKENNLHVVGYSTPVDLELPLDELQSHLYSLPEMPDAIPYITSYYKERWGFCLAHSERQKLKPGRYKVKIESRLSDGALSYGECYLRGKSDKEILLSPPTSAIHRLPTMSSQGPLATFLANWLKTRDNFYSYRLLFLPETIGAICYLSRHLDQLKKRVAAGFILTCLGDERTYSYLPSREGNSLSDQAARHVLHHIYPEYKEYSFLDRGSDERQYCSPGVDLPVACIMRSKYGSYPEYHTSLDNLELVSPKGLEGGFNAVKRAIEAIEMNVTPKTAVLCEPQLGKRGLYPTLSTATSGLEVRNMMNLLAYADGTRSLLDIADLICVPIWELYPILQTLTLHRLIEISECMGSDPES